MHAFVRFSKNRPAEIPESAIYIGKFATSDEQRQLLDVLNGGDEVGRPFIMSKQVPADRIDIVRKAFNDTMTDPAFLADMMKAKLPVNPVAGEDAEKTVNELIGAPPKIVAAARPIYQ